MYLKAFGGNRHCSHCRNLCCVFLNSLILFLCDGRNTHVSEVLNHCVPCHRTSVPFSQSKASVQLFHVKVDSMEFTWNCYIPLEISGGRDFCVNMGLWKFFFQIMQPGWICIPDLPPVSWDHRGVPPHLAVLTVGVLKGESLFFCQLTNLLVR